MDEPANVLTNFMSSAQNCCRKSFSAGPHEIKSMNLIIDYADAGYCWLCIANAFLRDLQCFVQRFGY